MRAPRFGTSLFEAERGGRHLDVDTECELRTADGIVFRMSFLPASKDAMQRGSNDSFVLLEILFQKAN